MERRLAAVLAADMAGYSRLMEIDERGTLARLMTHRSELIDPSGAASSRRPATASSSSSSPSPTPCAARSRCRSA
jgi:hypothetical protein